MSENYTLILNSQLSNLGGALNTRQYLITWSNVLPKKYATYSLSFTFKSVNQLTSITDNGLLAVNLGQSNVCGQGSTPTPVIGWIQPNVCQLTSTSWSYYYTGSDNPPLTISYPTSNIITVSFTKFDGTTSLIPPDYVLCLVFTPQTPNIPVVDHLINAKMMNSLNY